MTNLWSFLLQTLTASAAAALLLLLKALFRDKLPPSWHFAVWGVLGLVILLPAGCFGRTILYNWRYPLELLKLSVGDASAIKVRFPFPWITRLPHSLTDWLFVLYALGVAAHLGWYLWAWLRLRAVLRSGRRTDRETRIRIADLADAQGLRPCRTRAVPGLPGAFVCGWLKPVLVIPAEEAPEDTVLLHELLHLRSRDTLWTLVICLLRSLHWCNPLLVWCARRASADLESRCDQRVLERLEGEARRDYGRVLLGMAKDRFAKTPGATCFFNGARQLRPRIEAIARFKRYPVGMGLASVCVVILLTAYLFAGFHGSTGLPDLSDAPRVSYARAVSVGCATADGAVDAYARSVLTGNLYYRALCASEETLPALQALVLEASSDPAAQRSDETALTWDTGLEEPLDMLYSYRFCAQRRPTNGSWAGLLVFRIAASGDEARRDYDPDSEVEKQQPPMENRVLCQPIEARRAAGRWTVEAAGPFTVAELAPGEGIYMVDAALGKLPGIPGDLYVGEIDGLRAELKDWVCLSFCQTEEDVEYVDVMTSSLSDVFDSSYTSSWTQALFYYPNRSGALPPSPDGRFNCVAWCQTITLTRTEAEGPSLWEAPAIGDVRYGEPLENGGIQSGSLDMLPFLDLPRLNSGASFAQVIEPKWIYGTSVQTEKLREQPEAYRIVLNTLDEDHNYLDGYQIDLPGKEASHDGR